MDARRTTGRASIALALSTLLGCSAPPGRPRPHLPPNPDPHIQRAADLGAPAIDPAFDAAVGAYSRDLGTLRNPVEDVEIRKSLRLLAVALEHVPYAESIDLERTSAVIRGTRARAVHGREVIASPDDAAPTTEMDRGLAAIADAFVQLARGPYRNTPGLLERAYAVDEAARAARNSATEAGCRALAVVTLRRAEHALLAVREAAARGGAGRGEARLPTASWSE